MVKFSLGYRSRLALTYGVDWALAIAFALISQFPLRKFQEISDIDLTDVTIQYSFVPVEKVSNKLLVVFLLIPYITLLVGHAIFARKQWWDLHIALLGLTVTYSLTGTTVGCVRIVIGRPRPDFIARCNPKADAVNGKFFGLARVADVCQTSVTDELIIDGMRSFFSGHVVLMAAGFGFVSLYLAGKMHVFHGNLSLGKLSIFLAHLVFIGWVAATRISDHKHHWEDVSIGFILGLFSSFSIYRQCYPALYDAQCHLPFAPRLAPKTVKNISVEEGYPQHTRVHAWQGNNNSQDVEQQRSHYDAEAAGLIATPFNPTFASTYDEDEDTTRSPMQLGTDTYPMQRRPPSS